MATELPDYVTDANAVLNDEVTWRYKKAPDYSKTRKLWEESRPSVPENRALSRPFHMVASLESKSSGCCWQGP
jgi:hypothetical protein